MTTTKTYNLQQILSAWIVNNNPSGTKAVLLSNNIIPVGSNPSKSEMINILYNYYLTAGNISFITLIRQIPVNENISENQKVALANSYEEIKSATNNSPVTVYQSNARIGDQSTAKWWNDLIEIVSGSETTTTTPVVTTETTTSPLVIGGLIAAVILVLGLAYFFTK